MKKIILMLLTTLILISCNNSVNSSENNSVEPKKTIWTKVSSIGECDLIDISETNLKVPKRYYAYKNESDFIHDNTTLFNSLNISKEEIEEIQNCYLSIDWGVCDAYFSNNIKTTMQEGKYDFLCEIFTEKTNNTKAFMKFRKKTITGYVIGIICNPTNFHWIDLTQQEIARLNYQLKTTINVADDGSYIIYDMYYDNGKINSGFIKKANFMGYECEQTIEIFGLNDYSINSEFGNYKFNDYIWANIGHYQRNYFPCQITYDGILRNTSIDSICFGQAINEKDNEKYNVVRFYTNFSPNNDTKVFIQTYVMNSADVRTITTNKNNIYCYESLEPPIF